MDGRNFDQLTKNLAARTSRRALLRGLLGGAATLGSLQAMGSLAAEPSEPTCKRTYTYTDDASECCTFAWDPQTRVCIPAWFPRPKVSSY